MDFPEKYQTLVSESKGLYRDRGSKFISFAIPVKTVEEAKEHIERIRLEYHDARHHCFAYQIGADKSIWRTNDDREPSLTAGKPILGQIHSHDLTNILIVVVRYFGGTLLGVNGLKNAYKNAAADAISNSQIIQYTVKEYYRIEFSYASINDVMKILKEDSVVQSEQVFEMECSMKAGIDLSSSKSIISRLKNIKDLKIHYIYTQ